MVDHLPAFCLACLVATVTSQDYPNRMLLLGGQSDPILTMRWRVNITDVNVELTSKTQGWIAFGRSPDGKMDKSDILFAWIDPSGVTYVQDRFIIADPNSQMVNLTLDRIQNWRLVGAMQNSTHSVIRATRKLVTGDPADYNFTDPVINLIYSVCDTPPNRSTGEIKMHSSRGSRRFSGFRQPQVGSTTIAVASTTTTTTIPTTSTTTTIQSTFTTSTTTTPTTRSTSTTTTPAPILPQSTFIIPMLPLVTRTYNRQTTTPATTTTTIMTDPQALGTFPSVTDTGLWPTLPPFPLFTMTTSARTRFVWVPRTTQPTTLKATPALVYVPVVHAQDHSTVGNSNLDTGFYTGSVGAQGINRANAFPIQNWNGGVTGAAPLDSNSQSQLISNSNPRQDRRRVGLTGDLTRLPAGSLIVVGQPNDPTEPVPTDYDGAMNPTPDGSFDTNFGNLDTLGDGSPGVHVVQSSSNGGDINTAQVPAANSPGLPISMVLTDGTPGTAAPDTSTDFGGGSQIQTPDGSSVVTQASSDNLQTPINLISLSAGGSNLTANFFGVPVDFSLPQSTVTQLNTPVANLTSSNVVASRVLVALEQIWSVLGQLVTGGTTPAPVINVPVAQSLSK